MKGLNISQAREMTGAPVQCRTKVPCRILVVEDEPDIRRLNAEVLKRSGYAVDTAEDGRAGWKAFHAVRHAPDSYALLITDHNMPGLTGLALVKKLSDDCITLPVILASAALRSEDLFIRYPWLQPAATLPKPYTIEELLGTVRKFLRATDGTCKPDAPAPNRRRQPSAINLQL